MFGVYGKLGTIIRATHRYEDLIPAYVEALDGFKDQLILLNNAETSDDVGAIDNLLGSIEQRQKSSDYYESEEATYDLLELIEWLGLFAPPYAYFGATEGDGSDFGFWPDISGIEEQRHCGDLESGDSTPDTRTDNGYFLVVSDHGNMELYEWRDTPNRWGSHWHSVWSVV